MYSSKSNRNNLMIFGIDGDLTEMGELLGSQPQWQKLGNRGSRNVQNDGGYPESWRKETEDLYACCTRYDKWGEIDFSENESGKKLI